LLTGASFQWLQPILGDRRQLVGHKQTREAGRRTEKFLLLGNIFLKLTLNSLVASDCSISD
jgi:hypothetical protein